MRVLQLPSGADMSMLTKQLRAMGVDATSCSFSSTDIYSHLADIQLKLNQDSADTKKTKLNTFFQQALNEYDIFHFHFGKTFNTKTDLPILKRRQKKMIAHHRGSEVRQLSLARENNPYVLVKSKWTEEKIHEYLKRLSTHIDHAIVTDEELKAYITPYYKFVHVVPRAIDCREYTPVYPKKNDPPVIVHAPSHTEVKGTKYVQAAVDQLQKEGYSFHFQLIENLNHAEALKKYKKATVVIDQLRIGSYANLSMEAMAMGKPVICYIRDDLVGSYPDTLPIMNANPDTIYATLKNALNHPEKWEDIGKKSRSYVEEHHHVENVAKQLMTIYQTL